jgi:alpha-beta hydrolase superfamily lysophospholipase
MYRLLLIFLLGLLSATGLGQSTSYFQEDSIALHLDSIQIKGTLCIPITEKQKVPIVLIIAGSGPTDRNGNGPIGNLNTNAYKQLAQELAKAGIASLRYDKRGIALSQPTGRINMETLFEEEGEDIRRWIHLIRKDKRFSTLVLAGHSQGALMGLQAAAAADKFISLNGLGVKASQLLRDQLASQPPLMKEKAYLILDSLEKGLTARDVPPYLQAVFNPGLQLYWMDMFKIDPPQLLSGLRIPVLVIQGDNDIQVKQSDAQTFVAASPKAKLLILPGMNHILKQAPTDRAGNLRTYSDPALPIDPALIKALVTFIK